MLHWIMSPSVITTAWQRNLWLVGAASWPGHHCHQIKTLLHNWGTLRGSKHTDLLFSLVLVLNILPLPFSVLKLAQCYKHWVIPLKRVSRWVSILMSGDKLKSPHTREPGAQRGLIQRRRPVTVWRTMQLLLPIPEILPISRYYLSCQQNFAKLPLRTSVPISHLTYGC